MKAVLDTTEGLPDIIKTEYEFKDGKYRLKIEGDTTVLGFVAKKDLDESNTKLAEFRDNNRTLNGKVTELETKLVTFKDIDPAKHKEMADKIKELEKKGVQSGSDVADLVQNAVKSAIKPFEEREVARAASEKAALERADRELLKSTLTAAGIAAGVDERAISDYVGRGMGKFKVVDGEVVARNGDAPIFQKAKPAEILTVDVWAADELPSEAPHLYKPSRGGGAGGNGGSGGGGAAKKIISSDPLEFGKNLEGIAKGEVIVQQ